MEAIPLDRGGAALVDRDHLELAVWRPGQPLEWLSIQGTGFAEAAKGPFGTTRADREEVTAFGTGEYLLLWSSELDGGRAVNRMERMGLDGRVGARWAPQGPWLLAGAAGMGGTLYLLTRDGLYAWRTEGPECGGGGGFSSCS